jgi:hypothetical protein
VITNGVQYRFFTDLQERNILDRRPFFEFDFENLKETDICVLERFRREVFDLEDLIRYAEDLVYLTSLKALFKALIREPSEDLVRLAVRAADLTDARVNQKVVDRFKPLVKESLSAAILEIVGQSFLSRPESESAGAEPSDARELAEESERGETSCQPTEEELRAFDMVVRSVADQLPEPEQLKYQDRTGYFAILYGNGWFTRLCMQGRKKKQVILRLPIERVRELAPGYEVEEVHPNFGSCRIVLQSADDLANLSDVFVHAARDVASGRSRATGTLF